MFNLRLFSRAVRAGTPAVSAWVRGRHLVPLSLRQVSQAPRANVPRFFAGNNHSQMQATATLAAVLAAGATAGTVVYSAGLEDNLVVDVHKSGSQGAESLWYRIGVVKDGQIVWGNSHYYDNGTSPSVTIVGDYVVEVHKSQTEDALWYRLGQLKGETINWITHEKYDKGMNPKVSSLGKDIVMEVHESENTNTIWYRIGFIREGNKVLWGPSQHYDTGITPSVAARYPS